MHRKGKTTSDFLVELVLAFLGSIDRLVCWSSGLQSSGLRTVTSGLKT